MHCVSAPLEMQVRANNSMQDIILLWLFNITVSEMLVMPVFQTDYYSLLLQQLAKHFSVNSPENLMNT